MRQRLRSVIVASLLCAAAPINTPHAQEPASSEEAREEARRLFSLGSELFLQKKYAEALDALDRSYRLVPSPNSSLVAARCLRDLGRPEEAAERFAEAGAQAEARVAAGDAQYEPSAEAARKEGAAVRAGLSLLRVRVEGAEWASVETPFRKAAVGRDGLAEMLHRPGRHEVRVVLPSGAVVRRTADLTAGSFTTIDVDAKDALAPPPVAPPPIPSTPPPVRDEASSPRGWMLPLAVVAGGIGVAGMATFVGFGLSSKSTYDQLERDCAPICGPEERALADDGEREAVIANVGLAAGIAGLTVGAVLLIAGLPSDAPKASALDDAVRGRLRF